MQLSAVALCCLNDPNHIIRLTGEKETSRQTMLT